MTSVRGMAPLPTTAARSLLGCIGFMNAAFGVRFLPEDFRRLSSDRPSLPPFFRLTSMTCGKTSVHEDFLPPSSFLLPSCLLVW